MQSVIVCGCFRFVYLCQFLSEVIMTLFSFLILVYFTETPPTHGLRVPHKAPWELVHCKCPCPCPGHLGQQSCSTVKHFPFCRKQSPEEFSFSCLLLQPLQGPHKSLQQCLSPWPNDSGHYCCLPLRPIHQGFDSTFWRQSLFIQ